MAIISMKEILRDAGERGYAVGGFDSWNLESVQAIINAAEETRSPVVILISPLELEFTGLDYYIAIAKVAAYRSTVPVALQLNETSSLELVIQAIQLGFNSVMIEDTALSFDKYVDLTRKVTEVCHAGDIGVETQVGKIPSEELNEKMREEFKTDPEKAAYFVRETGIDALAVSVGNVHELQAEKASIDFDLLERIHQQVKVPLVMHGGTGFPHDAITDVIKLGVSKFNVGTILRSAYSTGLKKKEVKENNYGYVGPLLESLRSARAEMEEVIKNFMFLYRSAGKG